jgi:hypothetical protein
MREIGRPTKRIGDIGCSPSPPAGEYAAGIIRPMARDRELEQRAHLIDDARAQVLS